jgi:hypothetical protein
MADVGGHRAEITVVDADERRAKFQDARKIFLVMQFHQWCHAEIKNLSIEAPQQTVIKTFGN